MAGQVGHQHVFHDRNLFPAVCYTLRGVHQQVPLPALVSGDEVVEDLECDSLDDQFDGGMELRWGCFQVADQEGIKIDKTVME